MARVLIPYLVRLQEHLLPVGSRAVRGLVLSLYADEPIPCSNPTVG